MVNHPNRKKAVEVEVNRAEQNAKAWYDSIREMVAALEVDYDRLQELQEIGETNLGHADAEEFEMLKGAATLDGEVQSDAEAVRERIQEGPLSVEVRGDWHNPGEQSGRMPTEFGILLSWGGPALRLMGDLDEHGEPCRAYLQYQDWGTPWTDYYAGEGSGEILLTYAQQFYFGE